MLVEQRSGTINLLTLSKDISEVVSAIKLLDFARMKRQTLCV
jgi:hypothetical protein